MFLVQPLIAKFILPWFGGAPSVWTTCMLFFQLILLAGYAYAHVLSRCFKPRVQAIVHLALVAVALCLLPIIPSESWKPADGADPTLRILGLLLMTIGMPYFILAATSPLLQHWFSRTHPGVSPFRLYALSNVGSVLALLSFPVYFETHFTRTVQAKMWGWALVFYGAGCVLCAWKIWRGGQATVAESGAGQAVAATKPPAPATRVLWLVLPACASTLLLATTNMMCQEVAVIPFLWIIPLTLYLVSFIICFDSPRWYVRSVFGWALVLALGGISWMIFAGTDASLYMQLAIYSIGLFICCMVCHGELYRSRPDPSRLTEFYLMVAAGGALGGIFVAAVAPLIFKNYYELQWGILICGGLFLVILKREWSSGNETRKSREATEKRRRLRQMALAAGSACLVALGVAFWMQTQKFAGHQINKTRNFYGVLTVFKMDNGDTNSLRYLQFSHGRTLHGQQFLDPVRSHWPTTYYSENSGVGLMYQALPAGHRRIGVIGLGAGTQLTYLKPGDYMHNYEINPDAVRISKTEFTYLSQCQGTVEITLGDGRLSLEREPPQNFDLLVLDAFNSDAPPVHLLTEEAFEIYQRHLKTNGVIAVHISNKRLNLQPVIANVAHRFNYEMVATEHFAPHDQPWIMDSSWILLSHDDAILHSTNLIPTSRPPDTNGISIPLWTDDFASLFQIILTRREPQIDVQYTDAQAVAAHDLYQQGDYAGAIDTFKKGLKKLPRSPALLSNLAFLLATCPNTALRDLPEATRMAEEACELTHYHMAMFMITLAAIYSEDNRFDEAVWIAKKTSAVATETGQTELLQKNEELLKLYSAQKRFDEAAN